MIITILFPFLLNQSSLKSENGPLKWFSITSILAVVRMSRMQLSKNDNIKSIDFVTLVYFVRLANPYLAIVSIVNILKQ